MKEYSTVSGTATYKTPLKAVNDANFVISVGSSIKTDNPFMQILHRIDSISDLKAEFPEKYQYKGFVEEIVNDFKKTLSNSAFFPFFILAKKLRDFFPVSQKTGQKYSP